MWPETRKKVDLEMDLLHRLLAHHRDLLERARATEPDETELLAIAGILHSFYTGVENIFKRIAEGIDDLIPTGFRSHAELLEQMARPTPQRPAVISEALRDTLGEYMGFRHMYRHAYSFQLKWRRMSGLALHREETLGRLEMELSEFFAPPPA